MDKGMLGNYGAERLQDGDAVMICGRGHYGAHISVDGAIVQWGTAHKGACPECLCELLPLLLGTGRGIQRYLEHGEAEPETLSQR